MLFYAANEFSEFNLAQHFDETREPDVRIRMHELYLRTKNVVARERVISLEIVLLIGLLETQNAAVNLGLGKRENLARSLGLTENAYWKRAQAGRVLIAFPEFIDLVKRGLTHLSHISVLAAKITKGNAAVFHEELPGKTEREVRELVASVNKDGSRNESNPLFDIRLRLTKEQLSILDRAREVLSATGRVPSEKEVILKSLEDLLEKRDPVRKAARAKIRVQKKEASAEGSDQAPELSQGDRTGLITTRLRIATEMAAVPKGDLFAKATAVPKGVLPTKMTAVPKSDDKGKIRGRRGIPAATIHHVWNRDEGCCSGKMRDGERCSSRIGLQVDHVRPVSFGQDNRLENLRLLCRECNIAVAEEILGSEVMERYRWLNSRASF